MFESIHISANIGLAYAAYAVGTASPGPSNLAIMSVAMTAGRRPALVFALGVVSGSVLWGLLAAFGLSALLATYSNALVAMKILGGFYLIYLATQSARAAMASGSAPDLAHRSAEPTHIRTFSRGAAMHVTNPKAIFVWLSIVSLALPEGAQVREALAVVSGCALIGILVFCGYALAFSTPIARRIYQSLRRGFHGILAAVFGYAGLRLLTSKLVST